MLRKPIGVDGGRGDDHFQIGPPRQNLSQVPEQKIDVQAALVRLVDDERVVSAQQRIGLRFGQQNAVGHQLHAGTGRQAVLKSHLETHHFAERCVQLLRNALGHAGRRDAPGLRVADQLAGVGFAATELQGDLRQLRGLARAGFTADDDDLVLLQGLRDLVAPGRNRQRLGKRDRGQRVAARGRR